MIVDRSHRPDYVVQEGLLVPDWFTEGAIVSVIKTYGVDMLFHDRAQARLGYNFPESSFGQCCFDEDLVVVRRLDDTLLVDETIAHE